MPEIKKQIPLLTADGTITEEGWARSPLWTYNRENIAASKLRIKEWDYYSILSPTKEFGITLTASDLGYAGLFAICFLDFKKGTFQQIDTLSVVPLGKTGFPKVNDLGVVAFQDKKLHLRFETKDGKRTLEFGSEQFLTPDGSKGIQGKIELKEPKMDTMNIATSWKENRKAFYYNTKINCMPAEGQVRVGNTHYKFDAKTDFGALDWGRGVWTYKNRWYWSSVSAWIAGKPFGLNLGYGFSDRTPASENVILYDGKIHKLDEVEFIINTNDYMAPWKFRSNDNRLDLDFKPIVDRNSYMNFLIIKSVQHQVFGTFNGTVVLDDGKKIKLENILGFAEEVLNHY
ncbi:PF10974 family protein [Leptospira yanagawae serovar Saopaulo str. Sao Paulo = ATCC 700523]|uniref:PF10974 family protein n=1 Tax=Leptospira yanagawae serovar Saopaulo str. Sao Paulo = ATCC 700523 TaxID=1249483 RepID=A0A5E8HGT2_9LEPT|nr:DUF2804 domain-containing protein [Leptospira yanagawae]EOQ90047.1 PF10974 family protein [Leptospira yanagawae serovar Saopaulo str. Sao Paulo = ATCC 700523]